MLRVSVAPFAKLDLLPLLEFGELPPHKGVVVGVGISCDERPSPVNLHTHTHTTTTTIISRYLQNVCIFIED